MWSGGVAFVLVLGAAHVAARAAGARAAADLSKAVPIALLAGLVAAEPAPVGQAYRWLVFAGLLCSLGGDVWLLFPRGFVAGLLHFLVAHLLYIAAFVPGGPWNAPERRVRARGRAPLHALRRTACDRSLRAPAPCGGARGHDHLLRGADADRALGSRLRAHGLRARHGARPTV